MKPIIAIIFIATQCVGSLFAQLKYPASAIPDSLLKYANVVIREHTVTFQVIDKGMAIETEHKVMTLLNENAAGLSEPTFYYRDDFDDIEDIEASVYDAEGRLVRNLKKKDIQDGKPLEYFVKDVKYKALKLPSRSYPYTIEYTIITKNKGLMFYPRFQPQFSPSVSIEHARFELIMPAGLEGRYKEINVPNGCKKGMFRWEFNHVPACRPEPNSPDNALNLAEILTAPTEFSFGGIDGDMRSWQSYGRYLEKLGSSQTLIPAELKSKILAMVADCPDAECKIKKVYDYLQSNTRYFYIGFGIGGWQPAAAKDVDQYKYGDCKGLSNYTVAMLNAVGVPARYTIIRAGDDEMLSQYPDFPNAWFNHAIVCVPMENDTIWLECTSQTESCGFLSDFTDNRPALVVTPTGGYLLRTPKYDETVNIIRRETELVLQPNGSAMLKSKDDYRGIPQQDLARMEGFHDELRRKYIYEALKISDFEIKSLEFIRKRERIPSVQQNLELVLPSFAAANGKRLFVPLSPLTSKVDVQVALANRTAPVQAHSRGITEEDFLKIEMPSGYLLESELAPTMLDSPFGHFELTAKQEGRQLIVHRKLVLNSSIQPKETYPDFIAFLKAVAKADKSKMVLKKEDGP